MPHGVIKRILVSFLCKPKQSWWRSTFYRSPASLMYGTVCLNRLHTPPLAWAGLSRSLKDTPLTALAECSNVSHYMLRNVKCLVGVRLECYIYFAYCINNAFSPIPYHCDSAGFEIVHYRDVLMGTMRLKSSAPRLFTQPFIRAQIKENIKAPRHWPLWGEFTGDRWIPRTNGQ